MVEGKPLRLGLFEPYDLDCLVVAYKKELARGEGTWMIYDIYHLYVRPENGELKYWSSGTTTTHKGLVDKHKSEHHTDFFVFNFSRESLLRYVDSFKRFDVDSPYSVIDTILYAKSDESTESFCDRLVRMRIKDTRNPDLNVTEITRWQNTLPPVVLWADKYGSDLP